MTDPAGRRSGTDTRLVMLERDMGEVLRTVRGIDEALRFPENSPLGRQLIGRADANAANIKELREDVDSLQRLVDEQTGVVKFLRLASLITGVIIGIYTLSQLIQAVPKP